MLKLNLKNSKYFNNKNILITILICLEIALVTCAHISYGSKTLDKYVFTSSDLKDSSLFAIMVEDSTGEYKQSTVTTFPGYEYFYNQEKSTCMDMSGNPVENSVLYDQDNKKTTITLSDSSTCYLYFDKWKEEPTFSDELIASGNLWYSELDGDGYRYTGSGTVGSSTNPNNFVCFGTTDKSTCTGTPAIYMYRIIGVFKGSDNNYYTKLIKYNQLSSTYKWHSSRTTDTAWESSAMYTGLNGSYFLTNTTYSYMQNTTWTNRIADWTWTAVNTLTSSSGGPNYYNGLSPSNIYLHEMNKDSKTSTVGTWTTTSAKIGLMYASDFALSLGKSALALTTGTYANRTTLLTGWLHQNKNGYSNNEWLIDRYGKSGSYYYAYYLNSAGYVTNAYAYNSYYVRPVFYLKNDTMKTSGTGSLSDPIILDTNTVSNRLSISLSYSDATLTATITKGKGNLKKYCINRTSSTNNCVWEDLSSNSVTYTMTQTGLYYVHVIDDMGYMAHASIVSPIPPLAKKLISSGNLWKSGLDGDGYRFTGSGAVGSSTNPNNFVCFGTTDKDTCTSNPDLYMYRIIGVFADSNGDNHVKLIKYKQVFSSYWHSSNADVDWADSTLYSYLNGEYFLGETAYIPDGWEDKIENWTWSAVNTKTSESSGPFYYTITTQNVYLHELNRSGKSSSVGVWTTPKAKIGLMYVSDYQMSLGSTALSYTGKANKATLKTGWLHQSNNDTTYGELEWTISRFGAIDTYYYALEINSEGYVGGDSVLYWECGVRPVFYLTSNVAGAGTGTLADPYILY